MSVFCYFSVEPVVNISPAPCRINHNIPQRLHWAKRLYGQSGAEADPLKARQRWLTWFKWTSSPWWRKQELQTFFFFFFDAPLKTSLGTLFSDLERNNFSRFRRPGSMLPGQVARVGVVIGDGCLINGWEEGNCAQAVWSGRPPRGEHIAVCLPVYFLR